MAATQGAQSRYTSNLILPLQANEGLVNLRELGELRDANSVRQNQHTWCFSLLYGPSLLWVNIVAVWQRTKRRGLLSMVLLDCVALPLIYMLTITVKY